MIRILSRAIIIGTVFLALPACMHSADDGEPYVDAPESCRPMGREIIVEPTFGCATTANLEAMVADPSHLHDPAELEDAQGDAAISAVTRHRMDRVKPLQSGGTTAQPASTAQPEGE